MTGIDILMLEDDENVAAMTLHYFQREKIFNNIAVRKTYNDAVEYTLGKMKNGVAPELFIIDLNLTGSKNGIEFIEWVKRQEALANCYITVVSGVDNPEVDEQLDVLGVDLFVVKPLNEKMIRLIIQKFEGLYMMIHRKEPEMAIA